jgi:hypothetical protein
MRGNQGIGHRAHWRRNVLTALLAADREIATPSLRNVEQGSASISKQKAKTQCGFLPIRGLADHVEVTRTD